MTGFHKRLSEFEQSLRIRLEPWMPTIIAAIENEGRRIPQLVAALEAEGIRVRPNSLRSYIYRYRKKMLVAATSAPVQPTTSTAPPIPRARAKRPIPQAVSPQLKTPQQPEPTNPFASAPRILSGEDSTFSLDDFMKGHPLR